MPVHDHVRVVRTLLTQQRLERGLRRGALVDAECVRRQQPLDGRVGVPDPAEPRRFDAFAEMAEGSTPSSRSSSSIDRALPNQCYRQTLASRGGRRVLAKTGAASRAELALLAAEHGLGAAASG